jgi:hypothetical protein
MSGVLANVVQGSAGPVAIARVAETDLSARAAAGACSS